MIKSVWKFIENLLLTPNDLICENCKHFHSVSILSKDLQKNLPANAKYFCMPDEKQPYFVSKQPTDQICKHFVHK